jgi:hypothetical protein
MLTRRTGVIAAAVLVGVALGIFGSGRFLSSREALAAEGETERTPADIARAEVKLARQALIALAKLQQSGGAATNDPAGAMWSRRLIDALKNTGGDQQELIDAMKQRIVSLKQISTLVQRQSNTSIESLAAQYDVLEAEYAMAELLSKTQR